jgi:hypothetical protein
MIGSCEFDNKLLGFIKGGELRHQLSDSQLFKETRCSMQLVVFWYRKLNSEEQRDFTRKESVVACLCIITLALACNLLGKPQNTSVRIPQGLGNYGPREECGRWKYSIRPATCFDIVNNKAFYEVLVFVHIIETIVIAGSRYVTQM